MNESPVQLGRTLLTLYYYFVKSHVYCISKSAYKLDIRRYNSVALGIAFLVFAEYETRSIKSKFLTACCKHLHCSFLPLYRLDLRIHVIFNSLMFWVHNISVLVRFKESHLDVLYWSCCGTAKTANCRKSKGQYCLRGPWSCIRCWCAKARRNFAA